MEYLIYITVFIIVSKLIYDTFLKQRLYFGNSSNVEVPNNEKREFDFLIACKDDIQRDELCEKLNKYPFTFKKGISPNGTLTLSAVLKVFPSKVPTIQKYVDKTASSIGADLIHSTMVSGYVET